MACSGNNHEEFVIGLAGSYRELFVGIAAEIERMSFLSVKNHDSVLVLSAIKPVYQAFIVSTPNFTPKSGKVGCFYIFLTPWAGQKKKRR